MASLCKMVGIEVLLYIWGCGPQFFGGGSQERSQDLCNFGERYRVTHTHTHTHTNTLTHSHTPFLSCKHILTLTLTLTHTRTHTHPHLCLHSLSHLRPPTHSHPHPHPHSHSHVHSHFSYHSQHNYQCNVKKSARTPRKDTNTLFLTHTHSVGTRVE